MWVGGGAPDGRMLLVRGLVEVGMVEDCYPITWLFLFFLHLFDF